MPERRTHSKSRLGCVQCKSRRVKCDESFPKCGACRRRGDQCTYAHAVVPGESAHFGGAHSPRYIPLEGSPTGSAWHELHVRELELMHQWSTETCHTMAWSPDDNKIQQIEVPRLAFSHVYLLDTMFAFTALHLATLRPDDARELVDSGVRYQTRALTACRRGLESMGVAECTAMFHCSVLLGLVALGLRAADTEHARSVRPTDTLVQLAQLWRGTEYILEASKEFLDSATWEKFFPLPSIPATVDEPPAPSPAHALLEELRCRPAVTERGTVFGETIDRLQHLYKVCQVALEAPSRFAWIVHNPASFNEFLAERDPAACAIVLLYAVLLPDIESRWWVKGISQQLVDELHPVVDAAGPDYAPILEWVTTQIPPTAVHEIDPEMDAEMHHDT